MCQHRRSNAAGLAEQPPEDPAGRAGGQDREDHRLPGGSRVRHVREAECGRSKGPAGGYAEHAGGQDAQTRPVRHFFGPHGAHGDAHQQPVADRSRQLLHRHPLAHGGDRGADRDREHHRRRRRGAPAQPRPQRRRPQTQWGRAAEPPHGGAEQHVGQRMPARRNPRRHELPPDQRRGEATHTHPLPRHSPPIICCCRRVRSLRARCGCARCPTDSNRRGPRHPPIRRR